ncbi:DNA cytosine methyltransferase [Tessaracoccus massiliensis]|uniref:DNA cytosine methyltransferase n=1 Tax=Tessaracoccus massiliensis TaxID=1522311 RepID=UPI00059150CF|nr:DNA cytosine methyltransferase [Tessaracoccus massiliensis]
MLTITDIFAGAGGSSTGAASVPGVHVALAANHWRLAVDVHQDNHQDTDHACVDLHLEDPRNFPRTDVLWASPECTKWSIANSKAKALSREMGGDPTLFDDVPVDLESSDEDEINRSRLLMFDVLRFIEHHRYRAVVVENVVDVATQGKYARAWEAWRRGLTKLGYQFAVLSINSMHAQAHGLPAPQSRDRLYVVAWPEGERAPNLERIQRPKAWCPTCQRTIESRKAWKNGRAVGRYRAQYVFVCGDCSTIVEPAWLPASHAIDWTIQGQRIGDRDKPLSAKTMARIREGLRRYGHEFIIEAAGNQYDSHDPKHPQHGIPGAYSRVWPTTEPLRTLHTTATKGLILDAIRSAPIISTTDEPLRTQTTAYTRSLLVPVEGRDGKQATPDTLPKLTDEPLDTVAASGNHHGLLVPSGGTWHERAYPTDEAMRTVTTRENHGLLVPYYSASETAKPTSQPVGTLTTVDRYALVMRNQTPRGDAGQMVTPAHEPFRTMTASNVQSVLEPAATIDPEDCTFRMLEPHEIAAGMSFPLDYRWQGTKRERVRLAGNAVTPPAARDIVAAIAESMGVAA